MTFFVCWKSLASQNPQKNVFRLVTSVRQRNYIESPQGLNQTSDLRIPRCDTLPLSHRDCRFLCPMLMTRRKQISLFLYRAQIFIIFLILFTNKTLSTRLILAAHAGCVNFVMALLTIECLVRDIITHVKLTEPFVQF